ncbi:MAG: 50S ribosomal protein L23 [Candidatus Peregrinibacteria bacterium]
MDLSRVIIGQVVTEKAERQRTQRMHTLKVAPDATKIDVKAALKCYYDTDVTNIRVMRVGSKSKAMPRGVGTMQKRHPMKKVIVTLSKKSKTLDLTSFQM